MSSVLYGTMLRKRRKSPKNESVNDQPPGVIALADSLAALVPAEVLLVHTAFVAEDAKISRKAGQLATGFEHPWGMRLLFIGLLLGSMVLYRIGIKKKAGQFNRYERFGLIIPPVAFLSWSLVQKPSAIDPWVELADKGLPLGWFDGFYQLLAAAVLFLFLTWLANSAGDHLNGQDEEEQ